MNRDLYAVVVTTTNGITPRAVRYDTHALVSDLVTVLIVVNNTPVTPEDLAAGAEPLSDDVTRYEIWSWDGRRIPLGARAGQIPRPGVCFIVETEFLHDYVGGIVGLLAIAKRALLGDDGPAKFRRHISGPAAYFSGQPLSAFDVLVSAASTDYQLAADIGARLMASGLSTQQTVRPPTADLGDESLRWQILGCQVLISMLSPSSVGDPRVAIEAGAAWALRKPFVPVLAGLARRDLPPSMAAWQCIEADDESLLARLPDQIKLLVIGR